MSWIGPYRIVRRLGTGGMGTVFLARDRAGRPVAVKVLHEHLREDAALRQRFAHEVAASKNPSGRAAAPPRAPLAGAIFHCHTLESSLEAASSRPSGLNATR